MKISYHATDDFRCNENRSKAGSIYHNRTPQYALVYIWEGAAKLYYGKKEYAVSAGDVFQRFPEIGHDVHFLQDTISYSIAVPKQIHEMLLELKLPTAKDKVLHVGLQKQLLVQHKQIFTLMESLNPFNKIDLINKAQQWILNIHKIAFQKQVKNNDLIWLQESFTLLAQNLDKPIKIEAIAKKLNIGYSLFRKEFKNATGSSPAKYRIALKIEKIKAHLLQGYSVSDCAKNFGYVDVYALSAQFKTLTGQSPTNWVKSQIM